MASQDPGCCDQFKLALLFGPSVDEYDNVDEVTCCEAILHCISIPWKLLGACIPPRKLGNGLPAFLFSLIALFLLTWAMVELSITIGCFYKINSCVLAIFFISVGVALPELITSIRVAATLNIKYADAAIGSIAAANAMNIFIGLGLPWTCRIIASWYFKGYSLSAIKWGDMKSCDLSFAVFLFICASLVYLLLICCRRKCGQGELGGPGCCKWCSGILLILIWLCFAVLNVLNCYDSLGNSRAIFTPKMIEAPTVLADVATVCPNKPFSAPETAYTLNNRTEYEYAGILVRWDNTLQKDWKSFPIDKYEIQIKNNNTVSAAWYALEKFCDGTDAEVVKDRRCFIPNYELVNNYGFKNCN